MPLLREGGAFACRPPTPKLLAALLLGLLCISGLRLDEAMDGDFVLLAFEFGLRARFDVSLIQFRNVARWFRNGGWYFLRLLGMKLG